MDSGFWGKLKKPFTVLAPMANVTDWAFREIVSECGRPDVFYTEFISADGIIAVGIEKFKGELYFEKDEKPIVVQLFSSKPENMAKAAELVAGMGFDGIDINMGCPDRSIEKQGSGAALIKNPKLAQKIIKETINGAGGLPISVKTRLGYLKTETESWIPTLLDTGISTLLVHARTRKEMSTVPAHWDELGKISKMAAGSGKLVVGNGDVANYDEIYEKANNYGLDGIMVGRGIFTNPWIFNANENKKSKKDRINILMKHLDNFEKLWGTDRNFDTMKRFFKIYIQGWDGAKELRTKMMLAKSLKEAKSILDQG